MYTVVVCSNCRFVWIIENRPETSLCRRCKRRRKFKKLKKYYQTGDLEVAKLARAHTQAMVNDQEARFEKELESGLLELEIDEAVPSSTYLDEMGVDSKAVSKEVDNILHKNHIPTSKSDIVKHALDNHVATSLDEFVDNVTEYGLSEKAALEQLKKYQETGRLEIPDYITVGEIEEALDDSNSFEEESVTRSHSASDVIISGVRELDSPTEEDLINYSVADGLDREKVELYLAKLIEGGEITRGADGVLRMV